MPTIPMGTDSEGAIIQLMVPFIRQKVEQAKDKLIQECVDQLKSKLNSTLEEDMKVLSIDFAKEFGKIIIEVQIKGG